MKNVLRKGKGNGSRLERGSGLWLSRTMRGFERGNTTSWSPLEPGPLASAEWAETQNCAFSLRAFEMGGSGWDLCQCLIVYPQTYELWRLYIA